MYVYEINVVHLKLTQCYISFIVNYILSMLFVFKSKESSKLKEFLIFVILSVGGLLLNQLIMWIGTEIMSFYYLWVKVFVTFFVPLYNFVTRKIFIEKKA